MTMGLGGAKGALKADINVTPLADVILVLLINMMLLAPMHGHGNGPLWLPEAANGTDKRDTGNETVVAIDPRGRFYVNAFPVRSEDLAQRVQQALQDKTEKVVYLKADKDAKYSAIMDAMDALRQGQIEDIALITERKQIPDARAGGGR